MANRSRVLVTGGAGYGITGAAPAIVLDISAATALGSRPAYDLESGMATVWPDFDPRTPENPGTPEGMQA